MWHLSEQKTGKYSTKYRCTKKKKLATALTDPFRKGARGPFLEGPESFRTRKAVAKSRALWLQSCFIHIFLIWTEVLSIQEVSGVYTSPFLDTD